MRYLSRGLVFLLVGSSVLCGVSSGAASPGGLMTGTVSEVVQAGDAGQAREQGRALLRKGRAAEALIHLERALKGFAQAGDKTGEASSHDLLGELYERQGRYDIALGHYQNAFNLYNNNAAAATAGGNTRLPAAAAAPVAAVAKLAALSKEESAYNAHLMLAKVGNMLYRRGDFAGARATYERMRVEKPNTGVAGKVKRGGGLLGGIGAAIGSRDKGVQIGVPALGGALSLKQQLDLYRHSILYANYELGLGRVDYQSQQFDAAREHFENVLDATKGDLPLVGKLGQTRRHRTAARTSLGDVAFEQGRYKEAVKLYAQAAEGAKDDKRLDLMWPAQRGRGRSLWAQAGQESDAAKAMKMREEALAAYRQALETVETIRQGSLRADESRTSFLATTGDVFEEAAGALAEMALNTQGGVITTAAPLDGRALEYATEALGVVEQGRARSLLDLLNETGSEITGGVPPELLERRRENQSEQEKIAALLTGVVLPGEQAKKKSLEDLEEELLKLQEQFESIENQIRSSGQPRYAALTSALTLDAIRRQVLDGETALLVYSLGEERSHLFAVTRDALTVSRLPAREEIERQVVALRQQIVPAKLRRKLTDLVAADALRGLTVSRTDAASPATVSAYAVAANALYETLVAPAAPHFRQRRLLIVADGALNYVPFHALVTSAPPAGADFSTLPYLFKTNETMLAPSASVVAAIRAQRAAAGGDGGAGGLLLVADPVFDARDTRATGAGATPGGGAGTTRALSVDGALSDIEEDEKPPTVLASSSRGVLVRLTGTRDEAEQIASLAKAAGGKADIWLDLEASEANVEGRDLRQYRVLHFATHGLLNTERPQFTGVVLSLVGNAAGEDGFLRTDEVFNLRLGSPLVMLSACETGLGKEKRGEGVIGLTRAFMYAGAPTVGVSLWSVADKSTADLMTDFYKNLLTGTGQTPTAAMRAARLQMIAGKKYSAPFYWAPFVLVGDWR